MDADAERPDTTLIRTANKPDLSGPSRPGRIRGDGERGAFSLSQDKFSILNKDLMQSTLPNFEAPEQIPSAVPKGFFAQLVGITPGRVSQLIAQGLPVRLDGKIDVEAGREWLEANVNRRASAADPIAAARVSELAEARLARERAQSELLQHKAAKEAGRLVDRATVERSAFERARAERDAHLDFAARVAPRIAAELNVDPRAIFAILDREIREHLNRLADTPLLALVEEGADNG